MMELKNMRWNIFLTVGCLVGCLNTWYAGKGMCHTPVLDNPDWPPTHCLDPTYLPTCTLDSGHSDFPTTPGTLISCLTDQTCLPATPEDSVWLGSHMKMCTWCTGPSNRSSDTLEIHHHIMMSIKGHHIAQ